MLDRKRLEPLIAQLSRVLPQKPMRTSEALRAAQIDDRCAGEEAISELVRAGRVQIWADSTLRWIDDVPRHPVDPDPSVDHEQGRTAQESTRRIVEERDAFRAMIEELLKSAVPHPVEHPTMTKAWARARALLQKYA